MIHEPSSEAPRKEVGRPAKLTAGQKHILRLARRDAGVDGWAKVSASLYQFLSDDMPSELAEFRAGDDGSGWIRLTDDGANILDAMEWL